MIILDRSKYLIKDENYQKECFGIIERIATDIKYDSLFGYIRGNKLSEKLIDIIDQNKEEYSNFYKDNTEEFLNLKNRISWDYIKPYTADFEAVIIPLILEIEKLLSEKKFSSNKKSEEKIIEAKELLKKYIDKTHLIDSDILINYYKKLNEIKIMISAGSLLSYTFKCDNIIKDIEEILADNEEKYTSIYLFALKKNEVSKTSFSKYNSYLDARELKKFQEQYIIVNKLLQSQKYDLINKAVEMITALNNKLSEAVQEKKKRISENLIAQIERFRTVIWLEDWNILNRNVTLLIKEAEETGNLLNLNLDKFHLDRRMYEKKDTIMKFIKVIDSRNLRNSSVIVEKAEKFLSDATFKKDFCELQKQYNVDTNISGNDVVSINAEDKHKNVAKYIKSIFRKN